MGRRRKLTIRATPSQVCPVWENSKGVAKGGGQDRARIKLVDVQLSQDLVRAKIFALKERMRLWIKADLVLNQRTEVTFTEKKDVIKR